MRVGLVGQKGNERAGEIVADLVVELTELDVRVAVDSSTAGTLDEWTIDGADPAVGEDLAVPVEAIGECDLVVSIGGDGTFLYAARGAGSTPIMGVNLGEVGFLNAISPSDALDAVRAEVEQFQTDGTIETREMPRLQATGDDLSPQPALNEVVVQGPQRGHGRGVDLELRVDGSLYTASHADGLLIATATGSTAYNLSEGGPLVGPAVDGFVVTEMCASEPMPPLVVGTDSTFEIRVSSAERAHVIGDGRATRTIEPPAMVTVERAPESVQVAGPPLDFFAALGKLD